MNIWLEGSKCALTISSWWGVFLLIYLVIEFLFLITHKMLLIHKLVIAPYVYYQIYKMLPRYWKVQNHFWFLAANRKSFNRFEMFIELLSKFQIEDNLQINDNLIFNYFGKIVETQIPDRLKELDNNLKDSIKKYNRQQNLDDLGV